MTTQDIDLGVVARGDKGDKGDKGDVGPTGPAPTLTVGSVTKLNPSQSPTVSLSGSNGKYSMDFGIPQGATGDTNATATQALNNANSALDKINNLSTSGRNYIKNSESFTMTGNGTDYYDLVWYVYNDAFASNAYCHGTNKTRFSFYLTPSKALSTARTYRIYWRQEPWTSFGTITVPAGTTDKQHYELTMTTPTSQPIASQIFIRFMAQDTSDVSFRIEHSMLTIGDAFADWQPAPEDTADKISDLSANKANKSDLTWANISGKPSIPSTFNGSITDTSTDFNNLTSEGHYCIDISPSYQGKNGPNEGDWGLLDVKVAGRMVVQTYYGDQKGNVYVRNRHDATWTAWRQGTFWS